MLRLTGVCLPVCLRLCVVRLRYADGELAYNTLSPDRMDAPVHWPNTMQIATGQWRHYEANNTQWRKSQQFDRQTAPLC